MVIELKESSIWSEIMIRTILKWERAARVRFEITKLV